MVMFTHLSRDNLGGSATVMDMFGDTYEFGGGLGLICGVVMISVYYMCDMCTCLVVYVIFETFV